MNLNCINLNRAKTNTKQKMGRFKTFFLTVSNYSQLLKRGALTNYCIGVLADTGHWRKQSKRTVLHLPYTYQNTSTLSCQITLNSLQTLICTGRDTRCGSLLSYSLAPGPVQPLKLALPRKPTCL